MERNHVAKRACRSVAAPPPPRVSGSDPPAGARAVPDASATPARRCAPSNRSMMVRMCGSRGVDRPWREGCTTRASWLSRRAAFPRRPSTSARRTGTPVPSSPRYRVGAGAAAVCSVTVRSSAATSRPSASAQRSGNHELRAGFSLNHDALSEFFVGKRRRGLRLRHAPAHIYQR